MAAGLKLALVVSCALLLAESCHGALEVGYYRKTCPRAEAIVRGEVTRAVAADAGIGAGLIRLLFHDCFVQGCDASVLLDPTPENPQPEKLALPNRTLRGFEVIDAAKGAIEDTCPSTVSCADIVAFAARDASYLLSGSRINFRVPAGRLDGRRSNATETFDFLPGPFFNLSQLVGSFAAKGLGVEDMVTLSGAHSVGRAHCSSFIKDRLATPSTINSTFASSLRRRCLAQTRTSDDPAVSQDAVTAASLDSQYYKNVLANRGLLTSDAALLSSPETTRMVQDNAADTNRRWERNFGKAMVKMAGIEVKTGAHGEIRKRCRFVNKRLS
ncbi:hypothetical protein ACP70R_037573 [Stipagrostis hirtigluma subsp. patula]